MSEAKSGGVLGSRARTVRRHEPFVLDDGSAFWLVRSGSARVFSTRVEDGTPTAPRRLLFTARTGDALFALRPGEGDSSTRLILVGADDFTLLEVPLGSAESVRDAAGVDLVELVEGWVKSLSSIASERAAPPAAERIAGPGRFELDPTQSARAERGSVAWVRLETGEACLLGVAELAIGRGAAPLPLAGELWLEATQASELCAEDPQALEGELLEGLGLLHALILRGLELLDDAERESEIRRLEEREAHARDATGAAFDAMASVLDPRLGLEGHQPPLLGAARLVGDALGVEIQPPAESEDPNRRGDPLEAIARASRLRMRRVLLEPDWWKQDCGPLIAFLEDGHRPVALLRSKGDRYEIADPETGERVRATEETDALLEPRAAMLYPPLPDYVQKPWHLVRFCLQDKKPDIAFALGLAALVALLGMITPQAMAIVIDEAIPDANQRLLVELGFALVALTFGMALFGLAQSIMSVRLALTADARTQAAMWDRLLNLRVSFFKRYSTGDLLARVTAASDIARELNAMTLTSLLSSVMALLNLGLLFYYSAQLALIALVLGIVVAAVTIASGYVLRDYSRTLAELGGRLFGFVVQVAGSVNKIRIAAAKRHAFAHWAKRYADQLKLMLEAQGIQDNVIVFNQVLPTASSILLFWFGVKLLTDAGEPRAEPALTVGIFLAFNVALGTFLRGATALSNGVVELLQITAEARRFQPVLDAEQEISEEGVDPGRLRGAIALSQVVFRYSQEGPRILEDVSLEASPGEFVALVGPSGSGKSTIFRHLLGFEVPESGTVSFDGQELSGLDVSAVRRQIGVVLQASHINAGSIFENIGGGTSISLSEAWEAVEDAGLGDEIRAMPMGLHTMVSEGGTNLSGGQCQRLAIARALVRKPRILLLDEATSSLDNRTQQVVSERLERRGVTRLVIAHRLSTIRNAHRIYVLERGRVAQRGTFEELSREEGLFASMMARQIS
jgi:ATP-binding cassette subfamily C protein